MGIAQELKSMAIVDIFSEAKNPDMFIGRHYYLDYDKAYLLVADAWKENVGGIPQGNFILAFYENQNDDIDECLLLRAIKPAKLPTDNDVISSMVEYYKDNLKTSGKSNQLDDFTKYTFSFSGLECRVLGTFFRDKNSNISLGADVENFYSAHNYVAYKPIGSVLEQIVNFRDGKSIPGCITDIRIGKVRYSSSLRFQEKQNEVPVYVNPQDFLGKRTALFGMTRTGKSNTVKKIIEATVKISKAASSTLSKPTMKLVEMLDPFDKSCNPKFSVGQIIFDINGEYANKNLQDEGTAIFDLFKDDTVRYSVLEKGEDFKVMKTNFYMNIEGGFELIKTLMSDETSDYISSFCAISLNKPEEPTDFSEKTRYDRKVAAYKCCLKAAGFDPGTSKNVKFSGRNDLNGFSNIDPSKEISLDDAILWFSKVWEKYDEIKKNTPVGEHEWADDDLKALLVMLTKKSKPGGTVNITGYRKLDKVRGLHSKESGASFESDIINFLRDGKIVVVDLSQGDPTIQKLYSERICACVFTNSMDRFVNIKPNNFIQFYFEEAHNLFPKKDDKDLGQIYNRIAKEGAKLNLGMIYATQEVSSISSNILKNTQNWFIAHLNNDDELKEIKKFYDFGDFCDGLIRYSAGSDKGFVRMKTYSNAFVVPVQIDRFLAK